MSSALTDSEAIEASRSDPRAFESIFNRHFEAIHRYLRRRVGKDDADDLAAEAFVEAFDHRFAFDLHRRDALPWLYGIATNLLRHHYRDEERHLEAYARTRIDLLADNPHAESNSSLPELAAALGGLSPADRDVLLLVAWADLGYSDTAVALGIPIGTVRSRLSRARKQVKEGLEQSSYARD
jgi:RNA polymerase sigma factor (sigma-70 family)